MHIMYDYVTSESDDESRNMADDSSIIQDEETRTQEEQKRRRREIIGAMDMIPNDMDFNDGCVLLDILYTMRKDMGVEFCYSISQEWRSCQNLRNRF